MSTSIILLIVMVIFSAYFSATETAFSALNRIKIKNMAEAGNKRAKLVLKLCDKYDRLLSSILIGNNIVNILSTSVATALFVFYFPSNGVALSTIIMTVTILIFGEIGPKSIAKEMPEKFAMFSAPFINAICVLLSPLTALFVYVKKILANIFGVESSTLITDDELLTMVKEAQQDGGIDEEEGELIRSAIEFYDLDCEDILIPRVDMIAIDAECSNEEIYDLFDSTRFSRLPVYEETIDNIIGILYQKDFHFEVLSGEHTIKEVLKPALYISQNMKISDLLQHFQQKKIHFAIVTDEYGGTEGLVTLEDVIEELVGEIWDEHDEVVEEITEIAKGLYRVSANVNIDKLSELLNTEIQTESTTVGGWVAEELSKIPQVNDSFEYKNAVISVTKADDRRCMELLISVYESNIDE